MAYLLDVPTVIDPRGTLSVIDGLLPFDIKRIFFLYDVTARRGEHRQRVTTQALVALSGRIEVFCDDGEVAETFVLDSPRKCLVVPPEDYRWMDGFTADSMLLVASSHPYDPADTVWEAWR